MRCAKNAALTRAWHDTAYDRPIALLRRATGCSEADARRAMDVANLVPILYRATVDNGRGCIEGPTESDRATLARLAALAGPAVMARVLGQVQAAAAIWQVRHHR